MITKRILLSISVNIVAIYLLLSSFFKVDNLLVMNILTVIAMIFLLVINIIPIRNNYPKFKIYMLASGCELLKLFLVGLTSTVIIQLAMIILLIDNNSIFNETNGLLLFSVLYSTMCLVTIFWNGIIRVYTTSTQLGINRRILGIFLGWIFVANIIYLNIIIKICSKEAEYETQKIELNKVRIESEICKTKYPLLMVHGVFFRDFRYLNYWGRIPQELQKNGATIYYGMQQSAASVESCGEELAKRIEDIVNETGCEKINIIAHSKGGLDSRVAISTFGASKYVASLTTINTPHRGCIFSEYLLNVMPEKLKATIANSYNVALKAFGDTSPSFIDAVLDLTVSNCTQINEKNPDVEGILYESVGSYCKNAVSGRFPLNLSHTIVKHFDGKNDGLVATTSAKWGSNFTLLEPKGRRGISHGDMIDLNRENIDDFDVREFFVNVVHSLKDRGY